MKLQGHVAKRFTLRLDEQQWGVVTAVAEQLELSPAEVMRGAIYTLSDRLPYGWNARLTAPPPELIRELQALRLEVNRIGVNVNQLARMMHVADPGDDAELATKMREVYAHLDELTRTVTARVNHDS